MLWTVFVLQYRPYSLLCFRGVELGMQVRWVELCGCGCSHALGKASAVTI